MKAETVYLMVRVAVLSEFENISDTVNEIETNSIITIHSTSKVKVAEVEILLTRVPNPKKNNHGTQS
jgi:hypothetical protein